jgi:integrase
MPFDSAMRKYMLEISAKKKPNTRARENITEKHLRAFFDQATLQEITPVMVAKYRDQRLEVVGPSTLQKELAHLSHIYTIGRKEWGLDIYNPVSDVRRPALPKNRLRVLSQDEISHLLTHCSKSRNKKLRNYVQVMLHTAMRPSEAAGLRWGQLDFDARIVDLTITKTEPRRVSLTEAAIEHLLQLMPASCSCDEYIFRPQKVSAKARRRPNLYFKKAYDNAVKKAKLGNFTMHDLRHTAASHMLMSGKIGIRELAAIMGHKSMDMVQRYTHFLDKHLVSSVDHIEHLGL